LSRNRLSPAFGAVVKRAWLALAFVALAGASAFCAAQEPLTSADRIVPRVPNPSLVRPDALPRTLPSVKPAAPTPVPDPVPAGPAIIALVLPLDAPDYARAANAVRAGFLAAAQSVGATSRVRVISHGDGNVLGGFEGAKAAGARIVVGPLVRDDLRMLAAADQSLPLTIALNQLDDAAALPPQVYTLALSVESDARVIARRMRADNIRSVAVIGGDAPLMKRFAGAFAGEWLLAGGGAPQSFAFDASSDGLSILRRELSKSTADGALIALDARTAPLARSFVPRLPAYASALVNQSLEPAAARDLEGVVFVDLPWIVTPEDPALAKLPRQPMDNIVLDRLYALGLDAFAVARAFAGGVPERFRIAGATGTLMLAEGRHIRREGTLAVFRGGLVVPADVR
jgi:outer membrane PBP1 activator LpoA protein